MDYDYAHLAELSPGCYITSLTLTVDRVFIRETTTALGEPQRQVKESDSVDMICWDSQVNMLMFFKLIF